jgi:hypothetical protein
MLGKIVPDSYTIFIEGKDSMRKKKGIKASHRGLGHRATPLVAQSPTGWLKFPERAALNHRTDGFQRPKYPEI